MPTPEILRYAAFTSDPAGGNPAGVVLDATGLDAEAMQAIAADVGYSETAFVFPPPTEEGLRVRYYSPENEVPFCGHATIATGVAWAERHGFGPLGLQTQAGYVQLDVREGAAGAPVATLTSVAPRTADVAAADLEEALAALAWTPADLDPAFPPRIAFAGAWHLVLGTRDPETLAALDYDFGRLRALMELREWTTLQLVHRVDATTFRARNPFPPGGVIEDPATGAAAAAFGGYLRELGLVTAPVRLRIEQGTDMGRPSELIVDVPAAPGSGIRVTGSAVGIDAD